MAPPDISRRSGIVRFSQPLFIECIERGFPFPRGTIIVDAKNDNWQDEWLLLVRHASLPGVLEGSRIPYYNLIVDRKADESRFAVAQ